MSGYRLIVTENNQEYVWAEEEELQPEQIFVPTVEQRVDAIEQAILELAEVVANG